MSGEERRGFSRVTHRAVASLELPDGSLVAGEVCDVAVGGAALTTGARPPLGTTGAFVLRLGEPPRGVRVEGRAEVVRHLDDGIGLRFVEVDLDSYHHLVDLVRYNADDVEHIEAEIAAHKGLRRR